MSIPKTIHQIWLGEKRIPKHIKEYMSEIRLSHRDYDYRLWTHVNVPEMPVELKAIYDSLDHPAMKSDLLRIYVLYLYGGVYLDVDYKLLTHLDDLNCFNEKDAYVVYPLGDKIDNINNSILISSAKGNLISELLKNIKTEKQWLGPHFYGSVVFKHLGLNNVCTDEEIIDACVKCNLGYIEEYKLNTEIITHKFMASWYPGSEWKEKFENNNYE
jgi:hypothetical protein